MRTERQRRRWPIRACLAAGILIAVVPQAHAMDLSTAVQKAQAFDPTTKAAHFGFEAGVEKGKQGTALYLPQITATGTYTRLHINSLANLPTGFPMSTLVGDATGDIHGFGVTLVQPIYNAAVFAAAAELHDQAKLAGLQQQGADMDLILRTAQAYFGVLMAADNLQLTRDQKAAIAEQLGSAKARFQAGKTNVTDVRDAEARFQDIVAAEITASNNLAVQQDQFAAVVGAPPGALDNVRGSFTPTPPDPDNLAEWIKRAHASNLNILGAQIQVDINRHEIDKYRLRGRPELSLVASYTDMRQNGALPILVLPDKSKQAMVGVQLTVPLFAGGGLNAKYREALANTSQANEQLQATLLNTDVQVKQQFLNVQVGVQQIHAMQQAVVAAKSSLDANELGLKVGKRTTLDVLNAQQQYFGARKNLDAARYQYLLSRLNLVALVNQLGVSDVTAVNAYLSATANP